MPRTRGESSRKSDERKQLLRCRIASLQHTVADSKTIRRINGLRIATA
jgi:hypothetical protein